MHRLKLSILPLLLILAACSTLGVPAADTFNKRVIVANSLAESAANTIATLKTAGKLSAQEAQSALDRVRTTATGIDIASEIHPTDPSAADARLSLVIASLNALLVELEKRQ